MTSARVTSARFGALWLVAVALMAGVGLMGFGLFVIVSALDLRSGR